MVDEKLMTSVRYSSETQKVDFQRKIVGKTTARFVFTDAVQMYIITGKTAGQMSTALFGLRRENDELEKRVASFTRYKKLLSQYGFESPQELCDDFAETAQEAVHLGKENERLEKENAGLRQQLATIQEKCGADFEKVRFLEQSGTLPVLDRALNNGDASLHAGAVEVMKND